LDLFQGSKIQLSSLESVRTFRVKLEAYRATLDTYHIGEAEFAPNGQLYREIKDRKFTQSDLMRFHDEPSSKGLRDSTEGILEWLDHHQSILEYSQQGSKPYTPSAPPQSRGFLLPDVRRQCSYSFQNSCEVCRQRGCRQPGQVGRQLCLSCP
jgi:hypothetical protein